MAEVNVQVCGRREVVPVARLSVQELTEAVEQRLEVQPPFLFVNAEGRPITDDAELVACVGSGRPVVVKLTEGVLHDVSRRVDQLRHLQWGFISDQLAELRRALAEERADLRKCQEAVIEERGAREDGHKELTQFLQELRQELSATRSAPAEGARLDLPEVTDFGGLSECSRHDACADLGQSWEATLEAKMDAERQARALQIAGLAEQLTQKQQMDFPLSDGIKLADYATQASVDKIEDHVALLQEAWHSMRDEARSAVQSLQDAISNEIHCMKADTAREFKAMQAAITSCKGNSKVPALPIVPILGNVRQLSEDAQQRLLQEHVESGSSDTSISTSRVEAVTPQASSLKSDRCSASC